MTNKKITIEFDRKDLEGKCRTCLKYKYSIENNKDYCSRTDDDLINCNLIFSSPYKIKEQNNGNNS